MIYISAGYRDSAWFGVAWESTSLVATSVAESREDAIRDTRRCLPKGVAAEEVDDSSDFLTRTLTMLSDLERGEEDGKVFSISRYLSKPMRRILSAAASVPIGYVSTYGDVAKAADSEARAVGQAMASNPLYPVVPCHRIVGSDMSLVGYGGRQDQDALDAKLARLESEARGYHDGRVVTLEVGSLTIYPAERVIQATREADQRRADAERRKAAQAEAERLQIKLF